MLRFTFVVTILMASALLAAPTTGVSLGTPALAFEDPGYVNPQDQTPFEDPGYVLAFEDPGYVNPQERSPFEDPGYVRC